MDNIIENLLKKEPFKTTLTNYKYVLFKDCNKIPLGSHIKFIDRNENIKSGGYYIIEDLHWQPEENESHIKTKFLFENWKNKNWIESEFIKNDFINIIKNEIESINFYNSQSKLHSIQNTKNAFVYIKKL